MKVFLFLLLLVLLYIADGHRRGHRHQSHRPHFQVHSRIVPAQNVEQNEDARRRDDVDEWQNDDEENYNNENSDENSDENDDEYKREEESSENAHRRDSLGFLGGFDNFGDFDLHNFIRHKIEEKLDVKNVDGGRSNRNNFFNVKQNNGNKRSSHKSKRKHKKIEEEAYDDPEMYVDDIDPNDDENDYQTTNTKQQRGSKKMHRQQPQQQIANAPYEDPQVRQQQNDVQQLVQENVPGSQLKVKLAVGANNPSSPVPIATVVNNEDENTDDDSGSGSGTSETSGDIDDRSSMETSNQPEQQQQQPYLPYSQTNKKIPATSANGIQASSAQSTNAVGQSYPNVPIPPLIPIPLFYNSGESEGSASGMTGTNDVKSSKQLNAGESGYGESIQTQHSSGDWVQRAIDKKKSKNYDDDYDDDDDDDEEERWMKHKSKQNISTASVMNSPLQNPSVYQQSQQTQQQKFQQQTAQRQAQEYERRRQEYIAEYGPQAYANQLSQLQQPQQQQQQQQQIVSGYNNQYQTYGRQEQYNQVYNQPKEPERTPAMKGEQSAAAVSAASASFQQKVEKTWETQQQTQQPAATGGAATTQQGPWVFSEAPTIVDQPNAQQTSSFNWETFGTQQQAMTGECADTCPASCAPSCDPECCSRGKIEEKKEGNEKPVVQKPAASAMPEFDNIIAQSQQQQGGPVQVTSQQTNGESITETPAVSDQSFNSLPPGPTLQFPDVTVGPNGITEASPQQPTATDTNTASFYPQTAETNQVTQQQQQQWTDSSLNTGRFNVENTQQVMPQQSFSNQQPAQQGPSTADLFGKFLSQPVENAPVQNDKKIAAVTRPFDAPPPVASYNNPLAADANSPQQAVPAQTAASATKNFALKPIAPILLKVPSIVHTKKEGSDVKYPSPQCIKACETKCMPFCPNSCCGIPAERKRRRNKIYHHSRYW